MDKLFSILFGTCEVTSDHKRREPMCALFFLILEFLAFSNFSFAVHSRVFVIDVISKFPDDCLSTVFLIKVSSVN